jgi:hypothetical protein
MTSAVSWRDALTADFNFEISGGSAEEAVRAGWQ